MNRIFITFLLLFSLSCSGKENECLFRYDHLFSQIVGWDPNQATLKKINGGLTNHNYLLKVNEKKYFVRCSEEGTLGNSLKQELLCNLYASSHGIAPQVILHDLKEGLLITDFIEKKEEELNLKDPSVIERIACTIRILHNECKETHPIVVNPFKTIDEYRKELKQLSCEIPIEIDALLLPTVSAIQNDYGNIDHLVLCHMDIHKENMIDDGNTIWLIDWEYGGMGDPLFDLATFTSADAFSDEEMKTLFYIYRPNAVESDFNRFFSLRIVADVRWALWSLIQNKKSTIDSDYEQMAQRFINSACERALLHHSPLRH